MIVLRENLLNFEMRELTLLFDFPMVLHMQLQVLPFFHNLISEAKNRKMLLIVMVFNLFFLHLRSPFFVFRSRLF